MRIQDADGEETTLDVVAVPEGFSFQIGPLPGHNRLNDYVSVIVSPRDAAKLIRYLQGER